MKQFQSRVVATWVVALPIAFAAFQSDHDKFQRLTSDPQTEVARQLRLSQHGSFVGDFLIIFATLVVLLMVTDALANFIRRLMPDRPSASEPSQQTS
jgi:predicted PurR-regulated permease PerM